MDEFVIYKNNKAVDRTTDATYDYTELMSDTAYTLGVSRVRGGVESEVVEIDARTLADTSHERILIDGEWYVGAAIDALHHAELGGKK